MGQLSKLNQWRKQDQKMSEEELNRDAKNFIDEVEALKEKYQVNMQLFLQIGEQGIRNWIIKMIPVERMAVIRMLKCEMMKTVSYL